MVAKGEETSIPIIRKENETTPTTGDTTITTATGGNSPTASVDCHQNILNLDLATPKVTDTSQIFSIPAMSCRRVYISKINAKVKEQPTQDNTNTMNEANKLFMKKNQCYRIKNKGLSKINENDIYDVSNKSDIIVNITLI